MIDTCINKKTKFWDTVTSLGYTTEQLAQLTAKLNQKEFLDWYGNAETDSFKQPIIINGHYIVNDKREKISINDLFNDDFFQKRENYIKDLTSLDKIKLFIEESNISIAKRISLFKDTDYAEKLQRLLDDIAKLEENDHLLALIKHYDYTRRVIEDFELRFNEYDKLKGVKANRGEDKNFKNFVLHAHNFVQTFGKIKNLDSPVIDTEEEKEVILKMKALTTRIDELSNKIDSEIETITRDVLDKFITNPEVRKGVVDFLAAQTDESGFQLFLDAMGDSHVTFIAAIDKFFKKAMYDRDETYRGFSKDWDNFVESFGSKEAFNSYVKEKLLDKNNNAKFIPKYKDDYYTKVFEFTGKLKELKLEGKENTDEYNNLLNEYFTWKKENTQQKYVKEYYDALNSLIPAAREEKEKIDIQITTILDKGIENLTFEDHLKLDDLSKDMKNLKATYFPDGTIKTGKDLDIANSLFKYGKQMSEFYHVIGVRQKAFNKFKKEAEEKGEDELERFMQGNTQEVFTDDFWKFFKNLIDRFPSSDKLEKINDEIKQLTVGFKNSKNELEVDNVPKEILTKLTELQGKKGAIKKQLKTKLGLADYKQLTNEFSRYIKFVPTTEYVKTLAKKNDQLANGEITKQEYNSWYERNHENNAFTGQSEPISLWTKIRPKDAKFITRKPNKYWEITDIKPEYINKEYQVDNNGYGLPTNSWLNPDYQNLSDKDKENLQKIQDYLLPLTNHTKKDMIKNGYLPAVPNEKGKKSKSTSDEAIVDETGNIVRFIPFKYIEFLNQETLPKIVEGMNDEEKEKVQEDRKKIIEENKKLHADSVNIDLADTMKVFAKAALTNKFKHDIELDLKIFKEQMKRQKVKVTNAKGEKLFDKIASSLKEERKPYEITAEGSNTEAHFTKWLEGVFYEDFEVDEGIISDFSAKIQDFTSLRALGFNVLSAVNNKLIGNIQARIESAGRQYFSYSDFRKAKIAYNTNLIKFIANRNDTKTDNLLDGLLKRFDILISQDELSGKPSGAIQTVLHKLRFVKNLGYAMQHLGEHQIQNTALIAMLYSHKIVNGKIVNYTEFLEGKLNKINFDIKLTQSELDAEIKKIDVNVEIRKQMKDEFEKYPSLMDAFELKDGHSELKEGFELNENELFEFKQRVIGINQRLHGIYNTEDAAMIQRTTIGRLAMQFRKWMRPGWNRRFGRRFGKQDYNERVKDYEEGMYVTFGKFIFNPAISNFKEFRKDQEKTAYKAFKMILESVKDTFTNAKVRWHSMSEIEKANVRKTAVEFLFLISVTCLGFLAKHLKGDGDDDDEKLLIFTLYQADRLFGELTTFTPIGVVREGNRLFSSPSPVFNSFEDLIKLGSNLFMYPFRDDESRKFKTGIYHGESKIDIYINDMIPVYNQFQRLHYLGEQNQRYGIFR